MSAMEGINCGAQAIALSVNCTFGKLHKLQRINLQQTNQLIHCKFNTRSTKIKEAQCKNNQPGTHVAPKVYDKVHLYNHNVNIWILTTGHVCDGSRLCAQICTPSDQTGVVHEPVTLLLLMSNVKRNRVRWNLKFYWKIKIRFTVYGIFSSMFHCQCSERRISCAFFLILYFFPYSFIYLLWCKCLHAVWIGVESVREQ